MCMQKSAMVCPNCTSASSFRISINFTNGDKIVHSLSAGKLQQLKQIEQRPYRIESNDIYPPPLCLIAGASKDYAFYLIWMTHLISARETSTLGSQLPSVHAWTVTNIGCEDSAHMPLCQRQCNSSSHCIQYTMKWAYGDGTLNPDNEGGNKAEEDDERKQDLQKGRKSKGNRGGQRHQFELSVGFQVWHAETAR